MAYLPTKVPVHPPKHVPAGKVPKAKLGLKATALLAQMEDA